MPGRLAGESTVSAFEREPRDAQAGRTACKRHDHALDEQLTEEPAAIRAERMADGHLTLAAGGANQQQVRDVGAGNQENEPDRGQEHEQRRPHARHQLRLAAR